MGNEKSEGFEKSLDELKKHTSEQKENNKDEDSEKKSKKNVIKISKKEEEEKVSRNYVLKKKHVRIIDRLSKRTQRDKSEIVQIAIEYLAENVEVK